MIDIIRGTPREAVHPLIAYGKPADALLGPSTSADPRNASAYHVLRELVELAGG